MPRPLLLNHVVLFLCCSIFLGTGVSLVFFQFPLEPKLTPDNYMLTFVEPVHNATVFFTYMTVVMLVTCLVMLVTEWFTGIRWVPIVVLIALIAVTILTVMFIFPYNEELNAGIRDPAHLREMFAKWADLNRIRVGLWVIMWLAMMYWFYRMAWQARADR
jgi:hypothetical protein